jgi:tetratricopeptide (TPR) repeat protein
MNQIARWDVKVAKKIATRLAETLAQETAKYEQSTSDAALARGRVFALASYDDSAIENYNEALALDPTQYEAAARLVLAYLGKGQAAQALATAMKLAAEAPTYEMPEVTSDEKISAFTLLGNALVQNDRLDDAIKAYETARETSPSDSTAAARLAQLYLATGQPAKAIEQGPLFSNNPRFRDLASVITLGKKSEALLPSFPRENLASTIHVALHGRPLMIEGNFRVAPIAEGDAAWCASEDDILGRIDAND